MTAKIVSELSHIPAKTTQEKTAAPEK